LTLNGSTGQVTGTPSAAGTYNVTIFVTDSLVTVSRSFLWTITAPAADTAAPALAITSHSNGQTVSSSSVTIGGTATDSGRGGNGVSSVTVNGQLANGGTVSGNATASWSRAVTLATGANVVNVRAVDSQGNQATQQITLNYSVGPVSSATLTANMTSPRNTGTAITFTANGSGGVTPYQFKFFVQSSGASPQMVRDWSTTNTYTWTPSVAGDYTIIVWSRSAGIATDAAQASAQIAFSIDTPPPAPVTGATITATLPSPQNVNTPITFTGAASGGAGPYQFKFLVAQGGVAQTVQNWSTSATYTWTPTTAGDYTISLWARSAGVTTNAPQASAQTTYAINAPVAAPLSVTLASNLASPQAAGTTIGFSAAGSGGQAPYQYKWWVHDGKNWRLGQDWSSNGTFNWRPTNAGSYMVAVWARNHGVTANASQALAQVAFTITNGAPVPPLVMAMGSSVASPQSAGTIVTFAAAASGGVAPYQFKWWVHDGAAWRVAQNWSTNATFDWQPTTAGSYIVAVWGRNSGTTTDASQATAQTAYTITTGPPLPPLTVTSFTSSVASPQMVGTNVTFNAAATGGLAPYQFKWWVFDGSSWRVAQNWTTSSTFTWRPMVEGSHIVAVWVRSSGVTIDASQAMAQTSYVVTSGPPVQPLAVTSFTSSLASPQPSATTVTFSTTVTGGVGSYEFKWWVYDGIAWKVGRNWSKSSTFEWRPAAAGNYMVAVWVRNAGVKRDASQALAQMVYVITGS
jgi:hypothetical protein